MIQTNKILMAFGDAKSAAVFGEMPPTEIELADSSAQSGGRNGRLMDPRSSR